MIGDLALLSAFLAALAAVAWPLARWMDIVLGGRFTSVARFETALCRLAGVRPDAESGWLGYTGALLVFNGLGVVVVYALQRLQHLLPLNPQAMGPVTPDSAVNTAISFVTNTNWQGYAGESTLSHLTQMLGLTVQNFASAATGIVVAIALIRGFARHSSAGIGNPWLDLLRTTSWILTPLSAVLALFFVSQGVVQNFAPDVQARLVEPLSHEVATTATDGSSRTQVQRFETQSIAMGPVASQLSIKLLGTNGGGFFNANSAHPFENPTVTSNFVQMLVILAIPAALCLVLGRMVGDPRQGLAILATMTILFAGFALAAMALERQGNPALAAAGIEATAADGQPGGNMEGKESRFGVRSSALFATVTTAASCGAVNAMHDSFTPLGGAVPMILIQLGEVVFGGVGSGLYGMVVFAMMAVFVAGLMIGRTPEYLGKKIGVFEMKMVSIAILVGPVIALGGTALAVATATGRAGLLNPGPHGFSEALYALSSAANNNGSAFAGLSANTPFYNALLAVAMWLGRFGVIVPVLAIAGSLAAGRRLAPGAGTLPTHGPMFVALLAGTVLGVGLLNYVPALALGPVVEHLVLWSHPEGVAR